MKCQDCEKEKDDVDARICPYASEVHGDDKAIVVCDDCYHGRRMSV